MISFKRADDDTINLREKSPAEEPEFKIGYLDNENEEVSENTAQGISADEFEIAGKAHDKVKVKFDKFVNLIASHAYEEIFHKHADEDIILSTDLLTDLANSHEEKPNDNRKVILMLFGGIVIGVAVAWLFLRA